MAPSIELDVGYVDALGRPTAPNPKQAQAHASPTLELLYGGAAFGGKTDFLILEAIRTALSVPGAHVAFFRRTLLELKKSVLGRFHQLIPQDTRGRPVLTWNGADYTFHGMNGSEIQFGYCDHADDVEHYRGAQWILLCIDQVEDFSEAQYFYLLSRVRSRFPGVEPRVRLAANPKGGWLKRRFVRPTPEDLGPLPLPAPFDIWSPHGRTLTRQFIPAYPTDNTEGAESRSDVLRAHGGTVARA